jgi:hypothetical protein
MKQAAAAEYTKEQWWEICQVVAPDMSRDKFERHWERFCELQRQKRLQ